MTADSADAADEVELQTLYGPEHPTLDRWVVRSVGEQSAIALSAGRYPKAVPALDTNEDMVTGVAGPAGTVLAVADGHVGADAATAAIDAVAAHGRELVARTPRDIRRAVVDLAEAAADAVDDVRRDLSGDRRDTATALSVMATVGRNVWTITFGDTAALRIRGEHARLISRTGPFLVGAGATPKPRRERVRADDYLVAVCDGVIDHLGRDWPVEVARRVAAVSTPAEAAEAVVLAAMDGAAGDHLSCAVTRSP